MQFLLAAAHITRGRLLHAPAGAADRAAALARRPGTAEQAAVIAQAAFRAIQCFVEGARGRMKITRITTYPVEPRWLFLKMETDEGVAGWGECLGDKAHAIAAVV